MKDLLDKLSNYNLFNYLIPGTIFVIILKEITHYDFTQENNVLGAFLYYFIGLVISRFGSLIVEGLIDKTKIIKKVHYGHYVDATKKDSKIELFSEVNNMYRTFIATFLLLLIMWGYDAADVNYGFSDSSSTIVLILSMVVLFFFSHKKQTGFIVKRANHVNRTEP